MSEIKLNMRYPESRLEDVTDAYMRGFEVGLAMRTDENAKLRELLRDMAVVICVYDQCVTVDDCPPALPMFADKMRELGVEV